MQDSNALVWLRRVSFDFETAPIVRLWQRKMLIIICMYYTHQGSLFSFSFKSEQFFSSFAVNTLAAYLISEVFK